MTTREFLRFEQIEMRAQQIKQLGSNPFVLIPGATGRVVNFFSHAWFKLSPGSEVFTESGDNLAIKYTDASGLQLSNTIEMTGFIDQNMMTFTNAICKADNIVLATNAAAQDIVIHNLGSDFGGNISNDAILEIRTFYNTLII